MTKVQNLKDSCKLNHGLSFHMINGSQLFSKNKKYNKKYIINNNKITIKNLRHQDIIYNKVSIFIFYDFYIKCEIFSVSLTTTKFKVKCTRLTIKIKNMHMISIVLFTNNSMSKISYRKLGNTCGISLMYLQKRCIN